MILRAVRKKYFLLGLLVGSIFFISAEKAGATVIDFDSRQTEKICAPALKSLGPLAANVGDSAAFYVDDYYDYKSRKRLSATIRKESERAYFFVEDDWWNSLDSSQQSRIQNKLNNLGIEFDQAIYPKLTQELGPIWSPGIDNDEKITILFTRLIDNAAGYFNPRDEYSLAQIEGSNEREMIYLNVIKIESLRIKSFLAHEFQHLITFYHKNYLAETIEDVWLNELRSEYAPTLAGYDDVYSGSNLEDRVDDFLRHPSDSLTEWRGDTADYGSVSIFSQYLADHYGKDFFARTLNSGKAGIESINEVLSDINSGKSFSDVFTDWTLAVYLNDSTIGDGKYGYKNSNLKNIKVPPTQQYRINPLSSVELSKTLTDWQPFWYKFTGTSSGRILKFDFSGKFIEGNFKVPYIITDNRGRKSVSFVDLVNQSGTARISGFGNDVLSVVFAPSNQYRAADFLAQDSSSFFSFTISSVPLSSPVISDISPTFISSQGGDIVTIKGSGFDSGLEVLLDNLLVDDITFIDSSTIKIFTPPHSSGVVDIEIRNPSGRSTVLEQVLNYKPLISDGSLIRARGDYKVYIIKGSFRRHILDSRVFDFYGHLNWNNIREVDPEVRDSYQDVYWIRGASDAKVYEVNSDKTKHWLNMSAGEFVLSGRNWGGVFVVNEAERGFYKTGADVMYR